MHSRISLFTTSAIAACAAASIVSTSAKATNHDAHSASMTSATQYLSVSPAIKPGPDGKLHDAYSSTTFRARAGVPVKLVIHNTDDVAHGIDAPAAGVKIVVKPGTHTYTLLVKRAGVFHWFCNQPCDTYSMTHMGYMMGEIVAR